MTTPHGQQAPGMLVMSVGEARPSFTGGNNVFDRSTARRPPALDHHHHQQQQLPRRTRQKGHRQNQRRPAKVGAPIGTRPLRVGDQLSDAYIDSEEPLRFCMCAKIIAGAFFVIIVLPALVFSVLYLWDPETHTTICAFSPAYCNLFARGCDGVPASGAVFDVCGECGGDGSTC